MSNDLNVAKQRLLDKLGPNYNIYIQLVGKWFRGQISKEEFDKSAKRLIEQNFVLEHNKFWLAFFHHCANSASSSIQPHQINDALGKLYNQKSTNSDYSDNQTGHSPDFTSTQQTFIPQIKSKVRCLPNKVISHMKIFVIAWEMGLDSASDQVSLYINLALQHFLKNIITELICTKTAYRLRENRFKYAIGVKPMNPYLNNSLKIYSSNLEYDPYQIESNKMNSSLVDTYAYDSLFPSRLYEAQALYEYACSTTSVTPLPVRNHKKLKLSEISLTPHNVLNSERLGQNESSNQLNGTLENESMDVSESTQTNKEIEEGQCENMIDDESDPKVSKAPAEDERRLTLFHLLIAFLSNRTIIPSQSMYSINLERIFTKLSC